MPRVRPRREVEEPEEVTEADIDVDLSNAILEQGWISDAQAKEEAGSAVLSQDDYCGLFDKVLEQHHKARINACYRIVFGSVVSARRSLQMAYHARRREEYKGLIELARTGNVIIILPAGRRLT